MAASLALLPFELHEMIWAVLRDDHSIPFRDLNAFVRTCQSFFAAFNHPLYRRAYSLDSRHLVSWAVARGPIETLQNLFKAGLMKGDVDRAEDNCPLSYAARLPRRGVVEFLLGQRCKDSMYLMQWKGPLEGAIQGQHLAVTRMIMEAMESDLRAADYLWLLRTCGMGQAIVSRNTETILLLLNEGVDINRKISGESTPLALAIYLQDVPLVKFLIQHGASTRNVKLFRAEEPIDYAAYQNNLSLACLIVSEQIGGIPHTGLADAARWGALSMVKLLLKAGADPDIPEVRRSPRARSELFSPIGLATIQDSHLVVKALAEAGASPEKLKEALLIAIRFQSEKAFEELLDYGRVKLHDRQIRDAFSKALKEGKVKVFQCLVQRGRIGEIHPQELLARAIKENRSDHIEFWVKHGVRPYCRNEEGSTALHLAIQLGNTTAVFIIMNNAPNADAQCHAAKSTDGDTQQQCSCHLGLDTQDSSGRTALYLAAKYGSLDCVQILLCMDSTAIDQRTASGRTARTFVKEHKNRKFNDWRDGVLESIWKEIHYPSFPIMCFQQTTNRPYYTYPGSKNRKRCSICLAVLSWFEDYEFCTICEEGSFPICGDCAAQGLACPDPSHVQGSNTLYDESRSLVDEEPT